MMLPADGSSDAPFCASTLSLPPNVRSASPMTSTCPARAMKAAPLSTAKPSLPPVTETLSPSRRKFSPALRLVNASTRTSPPVAVMDEPSAKSTRSASTCASPAVAFTVAAFCVPITRLPLVSSVTLVPEKVPGSAPLLTTPVRLSSFSLEPSLTVPARSTSAPPLESVASARLFPPAAESVSDPVAVAAIPLPAIEPPARTARSPSEAVTV